MAYCMYLRKSRADMEAEERGEEETLARHKKVLFELAGKMNLDITRIYREVESGETISSRPVMQQLLKDVEEGMWEGVLVVEVERLARGDTIDLGIVAQTFKYSNTKIITPMKVYDPLDEFDEEYFEFGLFMSRREYKVINRRLQRGRIESAKEGKYVGTIPPYGYIRKRLENNKGYTLVPHPEQAQVVKLIFSWYIGGAGITKIVRNLNDMGIPTAKSGQWTNSTVQNILRNPVYIGKIRWNFRPHVKRMVNGKIVQQRPRTDKKDWILADGLHEPIIDEDTFEHVQKYLSKNPSPPIPYRYAIKNPFAGLIICGVCGRKMVRKPFKNGHPSYLICQHPACKNVSSPLYLVEDRLLQAIEKWLKNYRLQLNESSNLKQHCSKHIEINVIKNSINRIDKELENLYIQSDRLHDLLEQGIYSPEKFLERNKNISQRIVHAENNKRELINKLNKLLYSNNEDHKRISETRIESIVDLYYMIENPSDKNKLLKEIIKKAVYSKSIKGRWHNEPDNFELIVYPYLPETVN